MWSWATCSCRSQQPQPRCCRCTCTPTREVGFGDWLLEAALAGARLHGCEVLEGTALPGDRATKNLYERAGIKARKITVSVRL